MDFDDTGKVSLDHLYVQDDPRAYFGALRGLDYCIPQLAKPYFAKLIQDHRHAQRVDSPTVLDIGCSYGVNAALLKCDATIEELYERYAEADGIGLARHEVLARDRAFVRARRDPGAIRVVGLDSSRPALAYAVAAGLLDGAVHADLENHDPTGPQGALLAEADLVISTGCVGYVTERTIRRVAEASPDRRPPMAHFVLRMFPYAPVADALHDLGYEIVHVEGLFKQRRFASPQEQSQVLDTLSTAGVDPTGLEAEGWLYAQLFLSLPGRRQHPLRQRMTVNSHELSTATFGNEDRLPRVPLPTLEDSCRLFLEWCAPLLTPDELAATEAAVAEYLAPGSPAHALQEALERYDASPGVRSWLDTFWPARYLGRRDRIALNANFFFLFGDPPGREGQLARAAGLITSAIDYKLLLDREAVPAVVQRGRPMSMVQNRFLFSTTRIPGDEQDTVRHPYSDEWPGPSPFRHIVVFVRGHAFRMDVLGPDGRPYAVDDLVAGLEAITEKGAMRAATDTSVGRLTTKARAEWAASRRALLAHDPANAEALDAIETALFCVCLEDAAPRDDKEACDLLLHGDSGNRWFDKALSFVVFGDGTAGINVEHCGLDGTTILYLVDAMLSEPVEAHAARAGSTPQGLPAIDPVEFVLDAGLRADVQAAGDAFTAYADANATTTVSFDDFGSTRAKELGVSPDGFVQMAYQLAHKRTKGLNGTTYESIATRQYQNGRTEAMRVVTPEALRFVAAMDDPAVDPASRAEALRAGAAKHVARSKECQAGQAPEQHLWELQLIQQRRGGELGATGHLALYDSPGWLVMRDDYLSTSSAPSVHIRYFGFGATSTTCIGVAYVLLPDRFNLYLSTPAPVADGMIAFARELRRAVAEMQALLA